MNGPSVDVAAEHDAVPLGGEPGVLHAEVELVGIEVRDARVGLGHAQHVPGGGACLTPGVIPMLDPDRRSVRRMPGRGDVASGKEPGHAGLEPFVDEDAISHVEARCGREARTWPCADADDDQVALDPRAVGGLDRVDVVRASEGRRPLVRQQLDALALMEIAVDRPDFDTERAFERHRIGRQERDGPAQLPKRGRDLGADPAAADHDHPTAVAAASRIASASSSVRR